MYSYSQDIWRGYIKQVGARVWKHDRVTGRVVVRWGAMALRGGKSEAGCGNTTGRPVVLSYSGDIGRVEKVNIVLVAYYGRIRVISRST